MLFDLRSRGRRRTVQAVYLGLAIILGGGLVLFGVGTGTGGGGLLNAFGGGSSNQKQVISADEKNALKAVRLNPSDPSAWASLVQARWTSAGQGNNFNQNTGTFTASGKKELGATAQEVWDLIGGFYTLHTWHPDIHVTEISDLGSKLQAKSIELHGYNETERGARTPQKNLASMPSEAKISV